MTSVGKTQANERIAFQYNSLLARRTVQLCQETLDWVHATRTLDTSGKPIKADFARIKQVARYIKATFAPQIRVIADEELNLRISEVEVSLDMVYDNSAMFCYFKGIDDGQKIVDNHEVFSGTLASEHANDYRKDIFSALTNSVNLEIGKLKHKTSSFYSMWLRVYPTSFMTEELFTTTETPHTAEEHAATFVHELGHGLTMIEHCADDFFRADAIRDSILRLTTTGYNPNTDAYMLKHVTTLKDTLPHNDPNLSKVEDAAKLADDNLVLGGAVSLGIYLAIIILYCTVVGSVRFMLAITYLQLRLDSISRKNLGNIKTSDLVVTKSNYAYLERIADEFVSRHGLGAAMASGLSKDYRFQEIGLMKGHTFLGQIILQNYSVFKDFMKTPLIDFYDTTYDTQSARLVQMLENNLTIFKDETLPEEVREYYIKDTQSLIETINNYKSRRTVQLKELFWGTLFRIIDRKAIVDALVTANLSSDYDLLQRLTNSLIRNPLYYQSARIKTLISKQNKTE